MNLFSKVRTEGTGGYGAKLEAESEPHGTTTLFRFILSAAVKSLSNKCLLNKYILGTIFTESTVHLFLPIPDLVRVERIVSGARNNSLSVSITNMVNLLHFGVTSKKVNVDIGQT
jgi:hypothetical protein